MKKRRDMHPADILAAFKKRKTSLAALSRQAGLNSGTLANALKRPWPKGEFIIAAALGLHPSAIWPSRYYDSRGCCWRVSSGCAVHAPSRQRLTRQKQRRISLYCLTASLNLAGGVA